MGEHYVAVAFDKLINAVPIDDVSVYRIDHLADDDPLGPWNILVDGDVPVGALRFHSEIAYGSIGEHHEHFLHHRRHRRCPLCRRISRTARLNNIPGVACEIRTSSREF